VSGLKNVKCPAAAGALNSIDLVDKRLIPLLSAAIIIALAGLVLIQWRWIAGTIELKDQQFNEAVDNGLVAVADRLERVELVRELQASEAGRRMIRHLDTLRAAAGEEPLAALQQPVAASDGSGPDQLRDSLLNDVVRGFFSPGRSADLARRIDPVLLDSLLRDELLRRSIDDRCAYAVFGGDSSVVLSRLLEPADLAALRTSTHRVRLYRNDLAGPPCTLHVHLPDQQRSVLRDMLPMLIASALFVFLIIATSFFTLRTIWQQRRLSDIKTDLVNNLTHELKTPISTISLACEALTDPGIPKSPEQMQQFIRMIRDENKRLGMLVESVLQSAVVDSGRMRLRMAELDMHSLLADVVRNSAIAAENRGGRVELRPAAELAHISGDRVHLSNVFYNLVDNAVKYCEREPDVVITTTSDAAGLTISVRDNGIGIPRSEQRKVFERLYRVPTGDRHNVKGFGLGLSYVKAVVEQHKGSIRLESEPGQGSTFHIRLPFEHGRSDQAPALRG